MKFESRQLFLGVTGMAAACLLIAGMAKGQAAQTGQRGTAAPAAQRGAAPAAPAATAAPRGAAAPASQAQRAPMSEEIFKNVTVLKGIPMDEFMDTMGMFSSALTLNCIDCHVPESVGGWERFADETQLKRTARRMVAMVNDINKNNFGGVRSVTCYTCHHGDLKPRILPSLAAQYATPVEDANDVVITNIPGGPTVDQVFEKYIQALGGAQRLDALKSYSGKGTYIGFETEQTVVPMEIFAKAPSQRAMIVHMAVGDNARVFDGTNAWVAGSDKPLPLYSPTGGNFDGAKLDGILMFPAQLRGAFSNWRVSATGIDDKLVRVLQGTNPGKPPVNFYFDGTTGLLVRVLRLVDTAVGRVPTQIDYSNYREIGGVKIPFKWIVTWTNGQSTSELVMVTANPTIDAAKFGRPAPAAKPK
jgi:photosynthetic reaction center cytochrome c subunit